MWALCPPTYHDNDMPIDLRKKVVLQRELDEQRECYRESEDVYAPKDYSLKECRDRLQQSNLLPVRKLYPFMSEQYEVRCALVPNEEAEKPQDLRPGIKGTLETTIKKLHISNKLKQVQENGRQERCKSTDALLEKENANTLKKPSRSNSCPDLTVTEEKLSSNLDTPSHPPNVTVSTEIKHYTGYNTYAPEQEGANSPVIGGAKKRKSFVPLYGDRAPVFDSIYRSPSPQNLVYGERGNRSPSPKRPFYISNGNHSPSPKRPIYFSDGNRSPSPKRQFYISNGNRSPSPKRQFYISNGCHSPSPESHIYSERIYHSSSPKRPVFIDRHYYSNSPIRPTYDERNSHSPLPRGPVYGERGFRSPSPKRRPKSPSEHTPYEDYFSHPEVLLRRQLNQQNTPPYLLHVYDYYQHLVQRLREHSSPNVRMNSPVSPTAIEDDANSDAQRKRPCRALTGKHVRQGTGASLSTLLTLRQKIQERQKAKEHQPRNGLNGINNKTTTPKKCNPKKVKINAKSTLGKIQNC